MEEEPKPKAPWLLLLPALMPLQLGALLFGGFVGGATGGSALLDAIIAWSLCTGLMTVLMANRHGWAQAIAIVAMATALGTAGIALLLGVGAAVLFGLLLAVCGGGR